MSNGPIALLLISIFRSILLYYFAFFGKEKHIHYMNINLYKTNIKYFMSCTAKFKQPKLIFSFQKCVHRFLFSKCVYTKAVKKALSTIYAFCYTNKRQLPHVISQQVATSLVFNGINCI